MPNVYIETFGCQMNEADSQYVADRAVSAGYTVTPNPDDANVVILNTCTVRDNAERRAYGRMNHFNMLKRRDPAVKLVVMGCLAEQDRDRMRTLAPHVDAVYGTRELVQLGDALADWRPSFAESPDEEPALLIPMGGSADCIAGAFSHLRGFVTVQRGCSYYCTFCIVPHVRGRFDNRPASDILAQTRELVARGAREVTLVGQTVNAYRDPATESDFGDLCRDVCDVEGIERLTFISPHPKDFSEKMIRDLAALPQMNPRVHLPLQSGSDRILRRMNRKYTRAEFEEKVRLIRTAFPAAAITTDVIVAFPGETEDDFQATLDLVESGIFANAYMFLYSPRRGTPAARWPQVPREVAAERFARLADAQNARTRSYHDRMIGRTVRALIQGPSKKDPCKVAAKSLDNVTLVAPMPDDFEEAAYAKQPWLDVRVEQAFVWGAAGSIVGRAARFADPGVSIRPPSIDLVVS